MDSRDKTVDAPPVPLDYAATTVSADSAIIGVVLLWTMASCASDCHSMAIARMGGRTTYSTLEWLITGRILLMAIGAVFSARFFLNPGSERFAVTMIWCWAVAAVCLGGLILFSLLTQRGFVSELRLVLSHDFGLIQFAVPAAVLLFGRAGTISEP